MSATRAPRREGTMIVRDLSCTMCGHRLRPPTAHLRSHAGHAPAPPLDGWARGCVCAAWRASTDMTRIRHPRGRREGAGYASRRMTGYILMTAIIEPDGGQFAAHCPELDVSSFGDSVEAAYTNLREAVELQISCLAGHGELAAELERRRITPRPDIPEQIPIRTDARPGTYVTGLSTAIGDFVPAA